jgi:hypothetical protein
MKSLILGLALSLFTLCAFAAPVSAKTPTKQKTQWLFVVNAQRGRIQENNGQYSLILSRLNRRTLMFSDRPIRQATHLPTKTFFAQWAHLFGHDQPNAAFAHAGLKMNGGGVLQPLAVELLDPTKMSRYRWRFTIKKINGHSPKAGNFKNIDLFIDSASIADLASCRGGNFGPAC